MDSKSKYLWKNTSILTISNFSSKILVFLLVPLYTSTLTTEEYGIYEIIMSTVQLLIPFLTLNIVDGVLRFMMDVNANKSTIKGIGLAFIVISITIFFIMVVVNSVFDIWNTLKNFEVEAFLYFTFYVFNQLFIQVAKGQENVKELAISGVISTTISLIANVLLLVVIPMGLRGFFSAYILGQLSSALYLMKKTCFFKNISLNFNKKELKDILNYSIPLIFVSLGWLINNVSDRYVVTWLCGMDQNGIYSVAYKIPTIITTVQNIFLQAWTISAIKEYNSNDRDLFYKRTFFALNAVMSICCSFLVLTTKIFARLLYAKDFYEAWQYVPFLLVSSVFGAASGYIGPILSAKKNTKVMAMSTFGGAIVNLVLNFVLIYSIGVQGATMATAISNVIIYILRRKAIHNILIDSNYKKIVISWILISIQAIVVIIDEFVIMQIPIILMIVYIYRHIIIDIGKKILGVLHYKN